MNIGTLSITHPLPFAYTVKKGRFLMPIIIANQSATHISNAIIEDINLDRNNTLITVSYMDRRPRQNEKQTVRLVVSRQTLIFDERGNIVPVSALRVGMTINATISSAMTRSIPPQANAFLIRIVRRPERENITTGRIVNLDARNRHFSTMRGGDASSIIRFNVPENTPIFNQRGQRIALEDLSVGMQVRVRHASFMTASIPPQTTALRVQVI